MGTPKVDRPRCPSCTAVLFAREHDRCLRCGVDLPEALRLSDDAKAALQAEARAEILERGLNPRPTQDKPRRRADDSDDGALGAAALGYLLLMN